MWGTHFVAVFLNFAECPGRFLEEGDSIRVVSPPAAAAAELSIAHANQ
jgi:hypothetical protein